MRYSTDHKAATGRHILDIAAAAFRQHGVDGIGIKDVMAEAGLTHGGFYAHFSSRDDLVAAALLHGFDNYWNDVRRKLDAVAAPDRLEFLIRNYLRVGHRDKPESGCIVAALGSDMGRLPQTSRAQFAARLDEIVALLATLLPEGGTAAIRHERAAQLYAMLSGVLQMARLSKDQDTTRISLAGAVHHALIFARADWD